MRTFEERYTAWVDGRLEGAELAAFKKELSDHPDAEADRESAHQLGDLLRRYAAPPLKNEEFFSLQLRNRIEAEIHRPAPYRRFAWTLPHLAWAGVCCLLLSFTFYKSLVTPTPVEDKRAPIGELVYTSVSTPTPVVSEAGSTVEILEVDSGEPGVSVSKVESGNNQAGVVWVDGLEYLPADYRLE